MKVLALDTSGLVASVALADENSILAEYMTNYKKTHSVTVMPMIQEICNSIELDLKTIDIIAVSGGPGSFTGLRIGSATAKGLAHVLNIPIASIPTLEVLANNISKTHCLICPMLDARREQVYTALYHYEGNQMVPLTEMMAIEVDELVKLILIYDQEIIFLGDGFKAYEKKISSLLGEHTWQVASPQNNLQRASSLAVLALEYAKQGKLQHYMEHAPIYLRKPQAEREYEEKHHQSLE